MSVLTGQNGKAASDDILAIRQETWAQPGIGPAVGAPAKILVLEGGRVRGANAIEFGFKFKRLHGSSFFEHMVTQKVENLIQTTP